MIDALTIGHKAGKRAFINNDIIRFAIEKNICTLQDISFAWEYIDRLSVGDTSIFLIGDTLCLSSKETIKREQYICENIFAVDIGKLKTSKSKVVVSEHINIRDTRGNLLIEVCVQHFVNYKSIDNILKHGVNWFGRYLGCLYFDICNIVSNGYKLNLESISIRDMIRSVDYVHFRLHNGTEYKKGNCCGL